jgi:hypothetical protein
MLCATTNASALEHAQTKTRVWDFSFAEPLNTCPNAPASPRLHLENRSSSAEHASGSTHAQRAAASVRSARAGAGLAERAAAAGARYPKQVEQALKMNPQQLQKSVSSFTENIAKHQGYLKNPQSHVPNWTQLSPQHQQNLIHHWNNDIARAQGYRDIAEGVLGGIVK